MPAAFTGFTPAALGFFEQLAANNSKTWFDLHRQEFEDLLLTPLKALVADLSPSMLIIDPRLITVPAVDKTISRIRRDTRFTRDKSPYRTRLWISFKRPGKDWQDTPVYFCEISATGYRYGMGFYSASRQTMNHLRQYIEAKPAVFRKDVAFLARQNSFVLEGERYKRPLNPSLAEDLQDWHQRKNLYLICHRPAGGVIFSAELVAELREGFASLAPLYRLLWHLRGE